MLLCTLFFSLFTQVVMQEFGDIRHLLRFALGSQLNTMMSSCCVIRQLQCPVRQLRRMTSYRNITNDIVQEFERFSRCICSRSRHCVLFFPPFFLPDGADSIAYDATFVTVSTTSQYTCTYRGTRALLCQYRQSMRTGMMGFVGMGGYGPVEMLGSAGYLGEEMEEAMERMVEAGIPLGMHRQNQPSCRRCIPLQCAVRVVRETQRLRVFLRRSAGRGRQRYYQCLRQHSILPPQLTTANVTTTTTTTTAVPQPSTTKRPPVYFPLTPPPIRPRPTPTPSRPPTTTPTTTTTTTTKPPTTTTPTTTTPKPTTITTTSRKPTKTSPSTLAPKPTTAEKPTTPNVYYSTTSAATTTTAIVASPPTEPVTTASETTSLVNTTVMMMTTTTMLTTTTTPVVITRILVGSGAATPSTPPKLNAVGDVTETGSGVTTVGGGGVAGVVIGVCTVLSAAIACIVLLYRRRRHRHSLREEVDGAVVPTSSGKKHGGSHKGKHQRASSLPSVSSKKAVIDAEDADDVSEKVEYDDDDVDADAEDDVSEEWYTPNPTLATSRKPNMSMKICREEDDKSLYASLDDTAISSAGPASPVSVGKATNGSVSTVAGDVGNKARPDSKTYSNTAGSIPENSKIASESSGGPGNVVNVTAAMRVSGSRSTGDAANRTRPDSKPNCNVTGSIPANVITVSQSSEGSSKYYNLKSGIPKAADADYVNTPSASTVQYEKPRTHGNQQYVYTSLKIKETPACRDSASRDEPYYFEPCANPNVSGDEVIISQPKGAVLKNNDRPIAEPRKMVRRSSTTTSLSKRNVVTNGRIIQETVRSSSSRDDTTRSQRRSSESRAQGDSRTLVSPQDSNLSRQRPATEPRVDHDGYLLPVTSRKQQHRL